MEYPPAIAELSAIERSMNLDAGMPDKDGLSRLNQFSLNKLFEPCVIRDDNAAMACLSALHLFFDDLNGSHKITQDLTTPEGSFWHGVMHRREGDYSNAKYWFRKVKSHPVYEQLGQAVAEIENAPELARSGIWDPFAFVDLVETTITRHPELNSLCVKIQQIEWRTMFDFCVRAAINSN